MPSTATRTDLNYPAPLTPEAVTDAALTIQAFIQANAGRQDQWLRDLAFTIESLERAVNEDL